jgi:ABC-type protease/lipase transport system fused ATPase/permease subunit
MDKRDKQRGLDELRSVRRESRIYYWIVGIFSFFVNLLMLTGPLYMLQVYDRVLGSRSEATLIALPFLVVFYTARWVSWILPVVGSWRVSARDFRPV